METVSLRDVTPDNFEKIVGMKVRPDQQGFVAPNDYSLAESKVFPRHYPFAIYAGEDPVGFLMYDYWDERKEYWIARLMIAADHQGKGYGRAAMLLAIQLIRGQPGCSSISLSFEPENSNAQRLYASLGFKPTGEILEGEIVYRLDFS